MKRIRETFCLTLVLLVLVPFLDACTGDKSAGLSKDTKSVSDLMTSMEIRRLTRQTKSPDFELSTPEGNRVSLSQERGKVILLSFWTTW